jgi:hypothetical protein
MESMFKKTVVFSLAVALMLMGLCTIASAAQNVTNVSQKGSLLIFPKIDTSPIPVRDESSLGQPVVYRDTIVMIGNDYYTEQWVKCYWVNHNQEIQDFMFRLTPNQPVWFRASDGMGSGSEDDPSVSAGITVPPFFPGDYEVGELKCWAVDAAGANQVAFNHLYGNAMIFDTLHAAAYEYNAWAFTARGVAQGAPVGTGGTLVLSGASGGYDACPQYLLFNFFSIGSSIDLEGGGIAQFVETDLTLVPCFQDLRQDRVPTCTKAKFDIWNENETKYTGSYRCIKCWFEGYLDQIGAQVPGKGFGGDKFVYKNLHTTVGRFRVTGVASTVCNTAFGTLCTKQIDTPLLGLIDTEIRFNDTTPTGPFNALAGTTPATAGYWVPANVLGYPTIQWDIQGGSPEVPAP